MRVPGEVHRSPPDLDPSAAVGAVRPAGDGFTPGGIRVRRWVRSSATVVPALVAAGACIALGSLDRSAVAWAALLAVAILSTAALLRSFAYPHGLMATSRILAVLPALAGGAVVALAALAGAPEPGASVLPVAVALAAAAGVLVELVGARLLELRPLRVAVLGSPDFAAALKRELQSGSAEAVEVVGWLNLDDATGGPAPASQLGTIDSIRAAVMEHEIDLLVRGSIDAESTPVSSSTYDAIAQGCLGLPVRLIDGNQLYEQIFGHVSIGTIGANWFLYLLHPRFESTSPLVKRLFDLVGIAIASIFVLPLVAIAAVAVKLEDRGPVFYRQRRVGAGGREYEILKLRTMAVDAEADGAQWSAAGDPRVTRVGRLLRRSHIDEMPQVWNVLRGEMTLVGPRPERPEIISELERLLPHYERRLLVKPGVTGWAQVRCGYAGTEIGTAWKLSHDLFYLKHRSVLADALIVLETIAVAIRDSHRPLHAPQAEFLFGSGLESVESIERSIEWPEGDFPRGAQGGQPVPEISLA